MLRDTRDIHCGYRSLIEAGIGLSWLMENNGKEAIVHFTRAAEMTKAVQVDRGGPGVDRFV